MSVKRYDLDAHSCDGESGICRASMIECEDGDFVRDTDYDAAIRQRDAAVRYLAEELGDYFSDNEVDDAIGKRLGIPANEVRRILEQGK